MSLTFACYGYDRTEALRTGAVRVEGFDVEYLDLHPREIFDRMATHRAFSACEFSFSEFAVHYAKGDSPFVAIPAFPSKVFRHGFVFVNRGAGIHTPKDLEGRRVGLPLYTMTAALWQRGILHDDYGVDWRKIRWVQGAVNDAGGHSNSGNLPKLLKPVDLVNADPGKSLARQLADGDIDALIGTQVPTTIRDPSVGRLFPDFRAVERDYFMRTGIHPIMHLVAIRRDVHDANPGFAKALYRALEASKAATIEKMRYTGANCVMMPFLAADVDEIDTVFGGDAYRYGLEENRPNLETMIRYMVEQDYIPESIPVDDLFVPVD
jgi:4,5-dihydroxyphthalate decarboxylase